MDQALNDIFRPDYRATFRDGLMTFVPYAPWLARDYGFAGNLLRETVDVVVADFEIHRGDDGLELIVSTLTELNDNAFRAAVIEFAHGLGYRRVWMTGEVIELAQDNELPATEVETTCLTCGTTFHEHQVSFLLNARQQGAWPIACPLDGSPLPQWSPASAMSGSAA